MKKNELTEKLVGRRMSAWAVLTPDGTIPDHGMNLQYAIYPTKKAARSKYGSWKIVRVEVTYTP